MKQLLASLTAAAFLLTGTAMAANAPKMKTTTKAVKSTKSAKPMAKLKTAKSSMKSTAKTKTKAKAKTQKT